MTEGKLTNFFPHKHLLGIEGLLPTSIIFLLNLSNKFFDHLNNKKNGKIKYSKK